MIPVCQHLASLLQIGASPLLYGMIMGAGTGGNLTPV
jgi:Na+/H+ antiporter NhaD/arsenite permease-like protein